MRSSFFSNEIEQGCDLKHFASTRQKEKWIWIVSFWLPLTLTALVLFIPVHAAFTITAEKSGNIVYSASLRDGITFQIGFIHSVHETPVIEHYRVSSQGTITLEKVYYDSYGIGNPSSAETGETFRIEDGTLILEGMKRNFRSIKLRSGQIAADHQLIIGERQYRFSAWDDPGTVFVIEVKKVPLMRLLMTSKV